MIILLQFEVHPLAIPESRVSALNLFKSNLFENTGSSCYLNKDIYCIQSSDDSYFLSNHWWYVFSFLSASNLSSVQSALSLIFMLCSLSFFPGSFEDMLFISGVLQCSYYVYRYKFIFIFSACDSLDFWIWQFILSSVLSHSPFKYGISSIHFFLFL